MPVARNMKELENMIAEGFKKNLPGATRDFCHKWYTQHPEMNEIMLETEFIDKVKRSLEVSFSNGTIQTKLELFKDVELNEADTRIFNADMFEQFKSGYFEYLKNNIFK